MHPTFRSLALGHHQVDSLQNFTWQQQLRYYWDTDLDDCLIRHSDARVRYGYEYMGATRCVQLLKQKHTHNTTQQRYVSLQNHKVYEVYTLLPRTTYETRYRLKRTKATLVQLKPQQGTTKPLLRLETHLWRENTWMLYRHILGALNGLHRNKVPPHP